MGTNEGCFTSSLQHYNEAFANNSIGLHVAYSTNTLIFWDGKLESPECFSLHFQVGWLVIFLKQQNNSSQWLKTPKPL